MNMHEKLIGKDSTLEEIQEEIEKAKKRLKSLGAIKRWQKTTEKQRSEFMSKVRNNIKK